MRCYKCYIYHLQNKKLVKNSNNACWAGVSNTMINNLNIDVETKDYIYIDKYIEPEIVFKK